MKSSIAYRTLTEKLVFMHNSKNFNMPDSLLKIISHAFTEEEAEIASHLTYIPRTAKVIAQKVMRPLHEVEPVLQSLAERILIVSITTKGKTTYTLLPFVPGIVEGQLIWAKVNDQEYGKEFARLYKDFYTEFGDIIRPLMGDREKFEVGRVIPIEQSIIKSPGLTAVAFTSDLFSEIIDRNNSFALIDCPCRTATKFIGKGCDKPTDACSALGIIADFMIDKGLARRASKEEYIDAKLRAADAGLVNFVDNVKDPMQVCACCNCCCGVLRLFTEHNFPAFIADSHFEPVIDTQNCNGCSKCIKWCPVHAISLRGDKKSAIIDHIRCIGCGVCASKCDDNTISLRERANYQPPPDNVINYAIHRYLDVKKWDKNGFIPRASLGAGRILSRFVQKKVTGPKYKPYI